MASPSFAPDLHSQRRLRLSEIDSIVSVRVGPTRGLGNSQPACFNRQVAMYLAARVGRWSTTAIGRFYNGRDHSTVCHGIQRIDSLRESDPEVDALLSDLKRLLGVVANDGDSDATDIAAVSKIPLLLRQIWRHLWNSWQLELSIY
ncbi:MAG TPA: helix-turn-helix domain-containing protein [Bryobacteraceae bacterium]|nr:helix-turn-helix domain-containing protein [Bryobacteraceae bacterium]